MTVGLKEFVDTVFDRLNLAQKEFAPSLLLQEVGEVTTVSNGIVKASGLPHVEFQELVRLPHGLLGIAFDITSDEVGIVLLGESRLLRVGDLVERTGTVMNVPVGESLIGRVIDPLGRPLDGKGPVRSTARKPIFKEASPIIDRAPVEVPLQTGIKAIDALIPIGRGQRELILGDRKTGKSTIAIDTIINQRDQNVHCIYCSINQRASFVAKLVSILREHGAMEYTTVVVTEGDDPPGLAYIAPYAATSMGEYFMDKGKDVLVVYDDLSQHARSYRELSLLLRRPPGRSAYPGDIFYIHSTLLERATHLIRGGSLTALPIIETEEQNIASYIATNLISITDGQLYLSPSLFELGFQPAIDVNKSVSRVGGKAQKPAYRAVSSDLKLAYSQFSELEEFVRFGSRLDEHTRKIIEHGQRIRECFKQPEYHPIPLFEQIVLLLALTKGVFDSVPLHKVKEIEERVRQVAREFSQETHPRLLSGDSLTDQDRELIIQRVLA